MTLLHTELINGVKIVRLNYGKANAIDDSLLEALTAAIDGEDQRGIVLTGSAGFFSAGLNLPRLVHYDRSAMVTLMRKFHEFQVQILSSSCPVVAAVNGHCIAGGYIIALNCDYRIAACSDYLIGLNEMVLGISLPPIASARIDQLGATISTTALIGGELFTPVKAHSLRLVDRIVSSDELLAASLEHIEHLQTVDKKAHNAGLIATLSHDFDQLYAPFLETWFSESAQTHIRKLAAKLGNSRK
ncbi:MAG: enoyl-CoA hydratase/isomerase family protein [Candidatus Neomarinimicrobiota bacterium]